MEKVMELRVNELEYFRQQKIDGEQLLVDQRAEDLRMRCLEAAIKAAEVAGGIAVGEPAVAVYIAMARHFTDYVLEGTVPTEEIEAAGQGE